jgi:3'-phosphoadenosine 5'-phosphosulfate sulfotransferase (PAPS reductase)/FAD synthetase
LIFCLVGFTLALPFTDTIAMHTHDEMLHLIKDSNAPVLVAFSGGKDSIAMVLYLLKMGLPKERIHLHHHEVDGRGEELFDWKTTTAYCIAFAKAFGLKIFFSWRKGGIIREVYRMDESKQDVYFQKEVDGDFHIAPSDKTAINTRLKFPAQSKDLNARWCSATVKIEVLRTSIANNDNYLGEIFVLTGERREESSNRAKYNEVEYHATNAKKRPAISWRPIIDWTEEQVWAIIEEFKVNPAPAYHLGWSRMSCQLCIFNDPDIWATINVISPEKVERIAEVEKDIQFTLFSKQTVKEKVAAGKPFENLDPYWINQATGEWTAPIIVEQWKLPVGAFRKNASGSI